jgi:hypothetical protein
VVWTWGVVVVDLVVVDGLAKYRAFSDEISLENVQMGHHNVNEGHI